MALLRSFDCGNVVHVNELRQDAPDLKHLVSLLAGLKMVGR